MRWLAYAATLSVHFAGLIYFFMGFFPSKVILPGSGSFLQTPTPFTKAANNASPHFDRLIFMVVDAMRSDYMYSDSYSQMDFLHSLIRNGSAVPFTAFSNPPTVTLPRLKGITSGSAPSFLDAILNVADDRDTSQGSAGDLWVQQLKDHGKRIHFFGDDTWIKLFPDSFEVVEGTNSFFVSDFTEVDNNVTRHLDNELSTEGSLQWDALILHYLGLDHIGHKGGPDSVFMKPKQREMDGILKRLYEHIEADTSDEKTLLVVMGDHGMNELGNHGGSSAGETSPGLAFISPDFPRTLTGQRRNCPVEWNDSYTYYDRINQIDIVPTLAALMNFPVPKNNLGVVIPGFLNMWPSEGQRNVLKENYLQLKQLYIAKFGSHSLPDEQGLFDTNESIYSALWTLQDKLASVATDYNYGNIKMGLILSAIAMVVLCALMFLIKGNLLESISFITFSVIYAVHFHGSSLIEEEHQIWWFLTMSLILYSFCSTKHQRNSIFGYLLMLVGLRLVRGWNNSGQKYISSKTIGLQLIQNPSLMWILVISTYGLLLYLICTQGQFAQCFTTSSANIGSNFKIWEPVCFLSFTIVVAITTLSFSFKLCQSYNDGNVIPSWLQSYGCWILSLFGLTTTLGSVVDPDIKAQLQAINIDLSQIAVICIFALMFIRIFVGRYRGLNGSAITDISNVVTIYLVHQTRIENVPLFLAFNLIKLGFELVLRTSERGKLGSTVFKVTLFSLCLQNLSFFSMGNTNSLATLDLSNAYNGIKSYDVFLVGILTFVSAFAGPIFWSLSALQILFEMPEMSRVSILPEKQRKSSILLRKSTLTLMFYSIGALNLVASCTNFRFHLFVWTVFSPKLLYFASWSILANIVIDLLGAALLLLVKG